MRDSFLNAIWSALMATDKSNKSNRYSDAQADAQADAHMAALYQQRKSQHLSSEALKQKVHKSVDNELLTRVDIQQYARFGWLKASLLMTLFVLLALPFFAFIQQQVNHINVPVNTAANNANQGMVHNVELYSGGDDNSNTSHHSNLAHRANRQLPELTTSLREGLTFTNIIASTKQQKVHQFNQQIEQFIASNNVQLGLHQQSLYANTVAKGKLIKQKDMWFIEFCGEQPLLLAMDIIEETLLADPLLDETREGGFYDIYSNPTGIIAMLATPPGETKQCRD